MFRATIHKNRGAIFLILFYKILALSTTSMETPLSEELAEIRHALLPSPASNNNTLQEVSTNLSIEELRHRIRYKLAQMQGFRGPTGA